MEAKFLLAVEQAVYNNDRRELAVVARLAGHNRKLQEAARWADNYLIACTEKRHVLKEISLAMYERVTREIKR